MTTAPSCSLPRTHSADLPGDHCGCHRQEAEALRSPRFGLDLISAEETALQYPPQYPSILPSQLPPGVGGHRIRKGQEAQAARPHPNPASWLKRFTCCPGTSRVQTLHLCPITGEDSKGG